MDGIGNFVFGLVWPWLVVDGVLMVDAIVVEFSIASLAGRTTGNFSYSGCSDGIRIVVSVIGDCTVVIAGVELL